MGWAARATGTAGTLALLIVANLAPILGVAWFGWTLGVAMLLFWAESAIVGFWAMARVVGRAGLAGLPLAAFFVVHFGVFMVVHLVFVVVLFVGEDPRALLEAHGRWMTISLAGLFASHGVSFWLHFVRGGERIGKAPQGEMGAAYARVVVMHLVILGGGIPLLLLGEPAWALVLLVVLKVLVDAAGHVVQHRARGAPAMPGDGAAGSVT